MRVRTTFWLILIAAALFGVIYYYGDLPGKARQPETLLPGLQVNAVQSVEVVRSNRIIRAERTQGRWQLTQPLAYPGSAATIEQLVHAVAHLPRRPLSQNPTDSLQGKHPSEFGLEPPRMKINLRTPSLGHGLLVGHETLTGKHVYLQLVGEKGIFLAPNAFLNNIPGSADAWRDRSFVDLSGVDFNRLRVQAGDRAFEVVHEPTNRMWQMVEPLEDYADSTRINYLLDALEKIQITEFVTDQPEGKLNAYGLENPSLTLELAQGTNVVLELLFGLSPTNHADQIFALRATGTNVVRIPSRIPDRFKEPYTAFRDRQLLRFQPEQVDRLEIEAKENFTLERRPDLGWKMIAPTEQKADTALVEECLASLAEMKIEEFVKDVVTDFSRYELDPPMSRYTLKATQSLNDTKTNALLAQVDFGTNQTDQIALSYARRHDESTVYGVARSKVRDLPKEPYELRDRRIWKFNSSNTVEVIVHEHGNTRRIARDQEQDQWRVAEGAPKKLNTFSLNETLFRLSRFRAEAWVGKGEARKKRLGFPRRDYRITLHTQSEGQDDPATRSLAFGTRAPTGNPYASTEIDGMTLIFEFPQSLYEHVRRDLGATEGPSD